MTQAHSQTQVILTPDNNDFKYWLALTQLNISGQKILNILDHHPDIQRIFGMNEAQLQSYGFRSGLSHKLEKTNWEKVEQDQQWFNTDPEKKHLIPINDPRYPALLQQISGAPAVLFCYGQAEHLNRHQIAIVGSRNPTPQGKDNAREFAKSLAQAGAVITSGLALGIDGYAHQAAVDHQLPTIAVTGTGLDRIYPAKHKTLAEAIIENGALVSDFALGTNVKPTNFPARNRIITGMSLGTLVVEAAIKSGSLISARLAGEQGREVFAIPGSIHNPLARGCHALIKQGAKLVETGEEIIEELQALALWQAENHPLINPQSHQKETSEFELDADYQALLEHIDYDLTSIEKILQRSGLEIAVVSHMLLLLELNNHIESLAGGYQRKT